MVGAQGFGRETLKVSNVTECLLFYVGQLLQTGSSILQKKGEKLVASYYSLSRLEV